MKINEVIAHLEKIKAQYGNTEILHYCDDCCGSHAVDETVLVIDEDKLQMDRQRKS